MKEEMLAAAAVQLYSTYINYLNVIMSRQKKVLQRHRVNKHKPLKKRRQSIQLNRTNELNSENENGTSHLFEIFQELSVEYSKYIPMSVSDFQYLLQNISLIIGKGQSSSNDSVPAQTKLALTLRFLATGESYETLQSLFNISTSIISKIITDICLAINSILKEMITLPKNEEEWLAKTEGFYFPHCLGALDGKYVMIVPTCETDFDQDHKGRFSIELVSLVDSDYCFIFADIQPRVNDDDNNHTTLYQKITNNMLSLPPGRPLAGSRKNMPYVFLGDEAFALSKHVMVPFSENHHSSSTEKAFNHQLSHSRAVVQNAFGIMSKVFKVFKKPLLMDASKSSIITLTCILLHNYLRKSNSSRNIYSPPGSVDTYINNELVELGSWRNNSQNNFVQFQPLLYQTGNEAAFQTRIDFMNYLYRDIKHEIEE